MQNSGSLRTVVVDLTPVLPGGENGGAKVFVLELLRRLADLAPKTNFVLLTQSGSHDELAALDAANVRRIQVVDRAASPTLRSFGRRVAVGILRRLPRRSRQVAEYCVGHLRPLLISSKASTLMRSLRADLLFCPFTAPTYFEPGIPTVSVIYDLQYKTYPEFFSRDEVRQRDATFRNACRKSTMLVAISDYSRDSALQASKMAPDRIKTIHLHISRHSLRDAARDQTILDRLGLVPGKYLIYPANFWKHKNHEMLLTAFGIARREGLPADIRLVCTGAPGARQQWLKDAAQAMGMEGDILFPGYLSTAELLALTTSSTGVIFPSLYEGFGLPVIEAMATDVPIACSNVTSLPEVAGDAAILFDPRKPDAVAKAMIALACDKLQTAGMVEKGHERAKLFSESGLMAQQYLEVFKLASGLEHGSDVLTGVHMDGWIGLNLSLQLSASNLPRTAHFEIALPGWVPMGKITTSFSERNRPVKKQVIARGSHAVVSIPLPPEGGLFEIDIAPTFVPAKTGHGNDQRHLSAMLVRCEIETPNAERIVLYPEAPEN